MFGTKAELDRLRLHKELLVLQCDTNRLLLATQCRQLRQPDFWVSEAGKTARQHPLWTAALGIGAGVVAVQLVRKPGAVLGLLGRMGGLTSTVLSVWKMFSQKKSEAEN